MGAANFALSRTSHKMFVTSIDAIGDGIVGLVLHAARSGNTYCIALPVTLPAIAAFRDQHGQLDSFWELQGSDVDFHFCLPVTEAGIECVEITKIKKVKGKA